MRSGREFIIRVDDYDGAGEKGRCLFVSCGMEDYIYIYREAVHYLVGGGGSSVKFKVAPLDFFIHKQR